MAYTIVYHEKVVSEDIPALGTTARRHIQRAIESKLIEKPEVYTKPLRQSLSGYRKLRVGDYRIVCKITRNTLHILAIIHRSTVYDSAEKRKV